MKLDPFIEAEKIAGHSVAKDAVACSRSPVRLLPAHATAPLRTEP